MQHRPVILQYTKLTGVDKETAEQEEAQQENNIQTRIQINTDFFGDLTSQLTLAMLMRLY